MIEILYVVDRMGAKGSKGFISIQSQNPSKPTGQGHYKGSFATGEQFVTDDITSGPDVKKTPYPGGVGEQWGPYKKIYTAAMIGSGTVFTPPGKVDGVPILCQCRSISGYVRDRSVGPSHNTMNLGAGAALAFGSNRPACWEDSTTAMNPGGGDTFNVVVGHPAFYAYAANPNGTVGIVGDLLKGKGLFGSIGLGGGGRRATRRNRHNSSGRKTRRRRSTLKYRT